MPPLPVCRFPDTLSQFPFANTGIDFFGSFYIEDTKNKLTKYYGLIFTCMITLSAHLESCPDLNTDTFLNALRRFASRRCLPKLILSDNGKTFVGAKDELKRRVRSLDNQRIASELLIKNTVWKFNPPYGPHLGGAWERLIQNAKLIVLIILGSKRLTSDVFYTIMVETESMLNSRPLTHVAYVPDKEELITPNHFLVQRLCISLPPGDFFINHASTLQVVEKRAAAYEPRLETPSKRVLSHFNEAKQMVQTGWFVESQWPGVDSQRPHSAWETASGTNCGNVAWKRWICTRCQGKNGIGYTRPPDCGSRTCFGWLAVFCSFFFLWTEI